MTEHLQYAKPYTAEDLVCLDNPILVTRHVKDLGKSFEEAYRFDRGVGIELYELQGLRRHIARNMFQCVFVTSNPLPISARKDTLK